MRSLLPLLPVLAMTLDPASTDAQTWTPAEREAWAAVERGWEALSAGDVEGFMSTFHTDFLGWSMTGEAPLDVAGERSGTEGFLARYDWVSYTIEPVAVRVVGDDAIVHYRYHEVVRDTVGGEVSEVSGRATQVLRRIGGGWKTLTIMSGPTPS